MVNARASINLFKLKSAIDGSLIIIFKQVLFSVRFSFPLNSISLREPFYLLKKTDPTNHVM